MKGQPQQLTLQIDTIPNASALGLARTPTDMAFRHASGVFRHFSVELSASFWLLYGVCSYQRTALKGCDALVDIRWTRDLKPCSSACLKSDIALA